MGAKFKNVCKKIKFFQHSKNMESRSETIVECSSDKELSEYTICTYSFFKKAQFLKKKEAWL